MTPFTAFERYRVIKTYFNISTAQPRDLQLYHSYNKWSLVLWLMFSVGTLLAGNFMVSTHCYLHTTGAFILFMSLLIDMNIQSNIFYAMGDESTGRSMKRLAIVSLTIFTSYVLFFIYSLLLFPDMLYNTSARLMWDSSQPGYIPHVIACAMEWILVALISPYCYSFARLDRLKLK